MFTSLALLWLAGNALRLTILAVPPVIPLIHDELALSGTQVGILTGLPSMLLALAAVPGSLLIARFGVRAAMVAGLLITAVFGALRGLVADVWWLYAMTIAMAAGVAIMQVTMPPAVRTWVPSRIGFATAVYTNGLIVGEIFPVALMLIMVLPLVGGSWQWAFVFWSVPVAIIAVLVMIFAPQPVAASATAPRRKWWPDWRNMLIWRLGFMLGTINAIYFATNAFIPDYLRSIGEDGWISAALTGLNAGQLPASMLLLAVAGRLERKVWPYIVCGVLSIGATAGLVFGHGVWLVAAATLQGYAASSILILVLALPPLLAPPDDVHRVTAAMFTISYTWAVVIPVIAGALWDLTGLASAAFWPIGLCGILLIVLASAINHIPRQTH
ncbi:MFS transporter [Pseudolabrys sp. Root1462]|jgi:CP family cyanate transporter-like MFS transporter|uniref:MFS transporter n=1 Tax=Pseudolabrys sp. Root1462 TaxID=1736466 RepID=UPI00070283E2|nr:MFS transporter [Pseudolabrys sp. Root1462]KQY99709.1 MFS transporter [Pseudolabrys sp. Root1462]